MKILCAFGLHDWQGCKCVECGRTRDTEHDWVNDCERCTDCGKNREAAHTWRGCRCLECGKTRDAEHDWVRDSGRCAERCAICGEVREGAHTWKGCKCQECGKTRDAEHDWNGCRCLNCRVIRDQDHVWDGCICTNCGSMNKGSISAHLLAAPELISSYAAISATQDFDAVFSHLQAAETLVGEIYSVAECPQSTLDQIARHLMLAVEGATQNALVFHKALTLLSTAHSLLRGSQAQWIVAAASRIGERWPEMRMSFHAYEVENEAGLRAADYYFAHNRSPQPPEGEPWLVALAYCPANPYAWHNAGFALGMYWSDRKEEMLACLEMQKRLESAFRQNSSSEHVQDNHT